MLYRTRQNTSNAEVVKLLAPVAMHVGLLILFIHLCWHRAMPRAGASARAQKKVALQSEVIPEANRLKPRDRSTRIAQAAAQAAAKQAAQAEEPPEAKRSRSERIAQAAAKQAAQAEEQPEKRNNAECMSLRREAERDAGQRDAKLQAALEASYNGELSAEHRAVIRAASESDASCAQIVGAWATSANVLGCEKLFAVMYGGVDASPAERNEALDEAQEHIEQATAAIENSEEAIARGYLDDRDPAGTVLCASWTY
jgi:HD-GYP domain-containing protein (c-di-GMP phosphodiesterase class II)